MDNSSDFVKKRAPTLYGIIVFKIGKGVLFVGLALFLYCMSDNNLPQEWSKFINQHWMQHVLNLLRVHPANKFFTHIAEWAARITQAHMLTAAVGTLCYGVLALVEGIGMAFRGSWAGWLAISESGFFIPIEIYELTRPGKSSWFLFGILVTNIFIVWYLVKYRHRLFKHHFHHHTDSPAKSTPSH
jgi:uncharacterized membrane protein (DUF2068 family)